jgi:uncharacterized protein GlcG (DUF336 family)
MASDIAVSVPQAVISLAAAEAVARAAVAKAADMGVKVNVAVVDSGGHLAAFLRMPGAFLESIGIAQDKARTAAGFRMSTSDLQGALEGDAALMDGIAGRPGVAVFAGGLPIKDGDHIIGAIGVSGASPDQDVACAEAGAAAVSR